MEFCHQQPLHYETDLETLQQQLQQSAVDQTIPLGPLEVVHTCDHVEQSWGLSCWSLTRLPAETDLMETELVQISWTFVLA